MDIDCEFEVDRICRFIRTEMASMKRQGAVVGLSGGVDSAVCASLCVRALGNDRVLGVILPERESNPSSAAYAAEEARRVRLPTEIIDITPVLESFGAYEERDEAIRGVFPDYQSEWKSNISLPADLLSRDALNFFTLRIEDSEGCIRTARLDIESMRRITSATSIKQRSRMIHLYYHAERRNYFVCGTTNRTEMAQGYFVKHGDGGVDIEPIAHLYKTQVYQLAAHLGVIQQILERPASPDTYSLEISDQEFYFRLPFDKLDPLLHAWENDASVPEVCASMGLTNEQVGRVFRDLTSKHNATRHLRQLPSSLPG